MRPNSGDGDTDGDDNNIGPMVVEPIAAPDDAVVVVVVLVAALITVIPPAVV